MTVYSTIEQDDFSTGELIEILEGDGVRVDVALLDNCLARLQLAYVLQREDGRWRYCVPLFVDYIRQDDPQIKLKSVLQRM